MPLEWQNRQWCSLDSVSQSGERERTPAYQHQKTKFGADKGPSAGCPASHLAGGSPPALQPFSASRQSQPLGPPKPITSRSHCLGFSFEACHLPIPLPAKPQSSALAWTGLWGRCSQRVWLCKPGWWGLGGGDTLTSLHRNCRWLFYRREPRESCWAKSSVNWNTVKRSSSPHPTSC